ncbi:hypothetical protein FA378_05590 [Pseudomonas aeruginosa]|uniref:hypothetical protein n=1 Tax=Pseudomonas aeruginosa TaxID=287 RepID=UPI001C3EE480|nr:hypothetical protein [Pseudomonas aeruginosa]EJB8525200.1 hypothetical protein [Pseudomonas aeruginosa]MBV5843594.1 hypothetical protein [Pseudomonas aeruginosa]MCO2273962.1 hypothetical protein [Pseudomonas aeruginosa]MCO2516756.1 hypothetical protein [Pseudomonas aeruginosa]MCO2757381.1 hypothetical protein [Pseudomonas aeruginosa]
MELSLEQTWEIFEFTVLKRDEHQNLTDVVTVHLYDDDRDIFLNLKGYGEAAIQTAITAIKESLNISPFSLENAEPNTIYFNIGGNPPQAELRNAMLTSISKLQSLGFKLRKLEDTWV